MPGFNPTAQTASAPAPAPGMTRSELQPLKVAVTAGAALAPTPVLTSLSGLLGKAAKSKIKPAELSTLKSILRSMPGVGLAVTSQLQNPEFVTHMKTWVDTELAARNAKPTPEFQPSQVDLPPVATPGATVATVPAAEMTTSIASRIPWKLIGGAVAVFGIAFALKSWK